MPEKPNVDHLPELYRICREYNAAMGVACDSDVQLRLYRTLQELRACIIQIENP